MGSPGAEDDAGGVAARLNTEVAAGRLQADAAQREAAARLDVLRTQLLARQPAGFARLRSLARRSRPMPPLRGVYLWGGVGRGKTLLMDAFFSSLRAAEPGAPAGAERLHFYRFMRKVHARLGAIVRRERPLDVVAEQLAAQVRVLCLDEFFVADIGDAMILAGLFEGLFRRGVTLVTTSNVAPQDLYKDGLQRARFLPAIDCIRAHVDVIHLDGGVDYRVRQLALAPTYLDSARSDTAGALSERFAALAGGMDSGPQALSIEGRALHALNTAPGMAWFSFAELCDGPRSQNDYIELSRRCNMVFISDVPRFGGLDENAARRFITLIDELYDRRVKIVVSAAAPPAGLYGGDRLQFEFERTASRLMEMQTEHYFAEPHLR